MSAIVISVISIFISIFSVYFAYKSTIIAGESLKTSLFEKRWEVFLSVVEYRNYWISKGKSPMEDALKESDAADILNRFKKSLVVSKFLFGEDVEREMKRLLEVSEERERFANNNEHMRANKISLEIISPAYEKRLIDMFGNYMKIKNIQKTACEWL